MNYGNENYKGKEILILGGGDGALLCQLLKEDPAFVTMIDVNKFFAFFLQNLKPNFKGTL